MKAKSKPGRPSEYRPAYDEQAEKLAKLGAIDREVADFFGISEQTLNTWKQTHPSFLESLKSGKEKADAMVADRLYNRAIGYSHPEVHVSNYQGEITLTPLTKHYAPDTTACIFWLKNRRPDLWRDRIEHTGKDGAPIEIDDMSRIETARRIAYVLHEADAAIRKAKEPA